MKGDRVFRDNSQRSHTRFTKTIGCTGSVSTRGAADWPDVASALFASLSTTTVEICDTTAGCAMIHRPLKHERPIRFP